MSTKHVFEKYEVQVLIISDLTMSQPKKVKGAAQWAQQFTVDRPTTENPENLTEIYKRRFFLREFKELETKMNHRRLKKRDSRNVWKKIGVFKAY